eukprot:9180201-Lingulodinium_polyedra.AAC.1
MLLHAAWELLGRCFGAAWVLLGFCSAYAMLWCLSAAGPVQIRCCFGAWQMLVASRTLVD